MSGFYLKLTTEQAQQMISSGINQMFGGTPTKFSQYTYFVEDIATGDKYWRVENLQYDGVAYNIIGWLDTNYPDLTRYTQEYVDQFISEPEIP